MSARPPLEVADVLRCFGTAFRATFASILSSGQARVMRDLERCRTAALGGHVEACDTCDFRRNSYNSCGNRHCPKCQSIERARWVAAREADLLPVPYFHVVFTVPAAIADLALQNKRLVYRILFDATAETLTSIAADPRHLGARIGFLAVLHTWGQNLLHHPHLHCIVPGGGLSPDRSRWIPARRRFLLPVRVLARRFRRLFLDRLRDSFDRGELHLHGSLAPIASSEAFGAMLSLLLSMPWVVYAKPPFGGPRQVLGYLGRYTHRVAIANRRITDISSHSVTFQWKDYRDGRPKLMTLDGCEFLRRFLLHVLPSGFHRIRSYGWLANSHRAANLAIIRRLLGVEDAPVNPIASCRTAAELHESLSGEPPDRCPNCRIGRVRITEILLPLPTVRRPRFAPLPAPAFADSS